MNQALLDEEMQRKLAIESLFKSQGYSLLKAELDNFIEYADGCVAEHQSNGPVSVAKLDKLNHDLGRKAGLQMVLNVIQQFEEELAS